MEIRKLNASDVRVLAGLLARNMGVLAEFKKQDGEGDDEYASRVGQGVIAKVLSENIDELWEWLASLANMSVDEFDKCDMDAPLTVIETVVSSGQVRDFSARVQASVATLVNRKG